MQPRWWGAHPDRPSAKHHEDVLRAFDPFFAVVPGDASNSNSTTTTTTPTSYPHPGPHPGCCPVSTPLPPPTPPQHTSAGPSSHIEFACSPFLFGSEDSDTSYYSNLDDPDWALVQDHVAQTLETLARQKGALESQVSCLAMEVDDASRAAEGARLQRAELSKILESTCDECLLLARRAPPSTPRPAQDEACCCHTCGRPCGLSHPVQFEAAVAARHAEQVQGPLAGHHLTRSARAQQLSAATAHVEALQEDCRLCCARHDLISRRLQQKQDDASRLASFWEKVRHERERVRHEREKAMLLKEISDAEAQSACIRERLVQLREQAFEAGAMQPVLTDPEKTSVPSKCVICLEESAVYALAPCGHVCLCEEHVQLFASPATTAASCPICRTRASSTLRVYV